MPLCKACGAFSDERELKALEREIFLLKAQLRQSNEYFERVLIQRHELPKEMRDRVNHEPPHLV